MALKTDYKNYIPSAAMNGRRRYRMINNDDGTVSFEDETEYSQVGDPFGAAVINETNRNVNEILQRSSFPFSYCDSGNIDDYSKSLGCTADMTLTEWIEKYPDYCVVLIYANSQSNTFNFSLPVTSGCMLVVIKYRARGHVLCFNYKTGDVYSAGYLDSALKPFVKLQVQS